VPGVGDNLLIKSRDAEVAITPYSILIYGTADNQVVLGAAQNIALAGFSDDLGQPTIDGRVDVIKPFGLPYVELGEVVTIGAELICDADGHAIPLASGVAGLATIIGTAEEAGEIGAAIKILPGVYKTLIA